MKTMPSYVHAFRTLSRGLILAGLLCSAGACGPPAESAAAGTGANEAGAAGPAAAGDISGVVSGPTGPEAGVWVIAETSDLPTRFARIVVTNDEGRYLIPDLPEASYRVWARGYGLVDSEARTASPGDEVDLAAEPAPDARAAAHYYPAGYWFSLLEVPAAEEFPGTGASGNGISSDIEHQADWLRQIKSGGCMACHQLGSLGTRSMPDDLAHLDSSEAWQRRVLAGQAGASMSRGLDVLGRQRAADMFADWT